MVNTLTVVIVRRKCRELRQRGGRAFLLLLAERLASTDLTAAAERYPDAGDLAQRMIDSLPDRYIAEPLVGSCYSTAALARWKRLTRQAVTHQRKVGTLFAVAHKGNFFFPSAQFDNRGRQTPALRDLWAKSVATGGTPLEFAVWLQTPDPSTGTTPAARLLNAPDTRTPEQRMMDDFEPTIIQPPLRRPDGDPESDR